MRLTNRIRSILKKFNNDKNLKEVSSAALVTAGLKGIGALSSLLLSAYVARTLGAEQAGLFFLSLTVIIILSTISRVGLDTAGLRFVASFNANKDYININNTKTLALNTAAGMSFIVAIITALSANNIANNIFNKPELGPALYIMAFSIVPLTAIGIYANLFQGLSKITQSVLVLAVLPYFGTLIIAYLTNGKYGLTGISVSFVIAAILSVSLAISLWHRIKFPINMPVAESIKFPSSAIRSAGIAVMGVTIMQLILEHTATIILGLQSSSTEIALFSIANKIVLLTTFVLVSFNSLAAPKFAAYFVKNEIHEIEVLGRNLTKLMMALALPFLLVLIFYPKIVLLPFGPDFQEASLLVSIMAIGQIFNVATGLVGFALLMCGKERVVRNALLLSATINVALCMILVKHYGVLGAAIATAISTIFHNIILTVILRNELGITITPLINLKR